jgi:hypothetical protein
MLINIDEGNRNSDWIRKTGETGPMKCTICGQDHADQVTALPVGAKVTLNLGKRSIPEGTRGVVTGHCDDGRAIIKTEKYGVHTTHFWQMMVVPDAPPVVYFIIQQQDENGQWYDLILPYNMLEPTEANFRATLAKLRETHPTLTFQLLKVEVIG